MKKNKTIRIIYIVLILIVGLYFLINIINKGFDSNDKFFLNSKYLFNEKFDKEDSILFKTDELSNMKSILVLKSTYRNDIKCFKFKKQNTIYYTKIDLVNDIPMDQFIWYREKVTRTSTNHSYAKLASGDYDLLTFGEKVGKVKKIIFSLTGDGNQIQRNVYNKNFVSYYLPVSTFSLRYGEDAPIDIFFGGREFLFGFGARSNYTIMISFYKIHKSLYVLILIPDKNEMNLEGDLFGKIMNDNSKD
jgi:hypothetical protein